MMDALQQAYRAAQNADVLNRPNDPLQELEFARMYATIAQAEQLKRLADMLEPLVEEWGKPRMVIRGADDEGIWAVVDGLNQRID